MSQMATTPVFKCRKCGAAVAVTHLSTASKDPQNELLKELMKGLGSIALCAECLRAYNWYASRNRVDEFEKNYMNPHIVLYNVHDPSEVDYYGRKS